MLRRLILAGSLSVALTFALTGCQKSADQSSSSASAAAPAGDSSSPSAGASAAPSGNTAPAPQPIVIPADTTLLVVLDESLGSKTSNSGQTFSASLRDPIVVDGQDVIPKGARVTGLVKDAKSAGRFKGAASLSLELTSINIHGHDHNVHTASRDWVTKGKGKRTAVLVGGGGALGALVGGLAGGGKGAAIGAAAGAGAGAGGAGLTGNRDISLPAETPVSFKLTQSLELRR